MKQRRTSTASVPLSIERIPKKEFLISSWIFRVELRSVLVTLSVCTAPLIAILPYRGRSNEYVGELEALTIEL